MLPFRNLQKLKIFFRTAKSTIAGSLKLPEISLTWFLKDCKCTPFFFTDNLFLTLAPKIVSAFQKNGPKKLFSNCLVDRLVNCLNIQTF